jgi:hypothetical protein
MHLLLFLRPHTTLGCHLQSITLTILILFPHIISILDTLDKDTILPLIITCILLPTPPHTMVVLQHSILQAVIPHIHTKGLDMVIKGRAWVPQQIDITRQLIR